MKILLGDFRIWRIKRFAVISTVIILIIVILSISDIDRARVNTFIIAIALLIIGVIADSKLFRKEYITECEEKGNYVYIKNKKMNRKINRKDISNIYYKEIAYGGRWLKVIGFRLIVECKNDKYTFDSVYKENCKWEDTDLIKLYNILCNKII